MNELQTKQTVFVKNVGFTKEDGTKKRHVHELEWTMDYDGNEAITTNIDGKKEHHTAHLTNQDLENMLHIPAIDAPIHQRLERDFSLLVRKPTKKNEKTQKTRKNKKTQKKSKKNKRH
jgi:hypothetical protein